MPEILKVLVLTVSLLTGFSYASAVYAEFVAKAVVEIKGTMPDSPIAGTAIFNETDAGVLVNVDVKNVPNPGKHGFHIHENGDCSDNGKAAGGHYNPMGVTHGHVPTDGLEKAHAGDMGNITIAEDGTGKLEVLLTHVHLTEYHNNITGLAVILHEKEDDFGQPTGNAGGRIGCGIITLVDPAADMKDGSATTNTP